MSVAIKNGRFEPSTAFGANFDSASSDTGVWVLNFPDGYPRTKPLFRTYDSYGAGVASMRTTILMTREDGETSPITEALLDFETEGRWLVQSRVIARFGHREFRIRFESGHDADMFKLFGIKGKTTGA